MEKVLENLVTQAPGTVAVIVVVAYFLRHLKERDKLFVESMAQLTAQIREMQTSLEIHAQQTSDGIEEMHRRVSARKREAKAAGK